MSVSTLRPLCEQKATFEVPSNVIESSRYGVPMLGLSPFEIAILNGIAGGLQSKEIAVRLDRSRGTIESYVRILFAKLNANSRAHLVAIAFANGILDGTSLDDSSLVQ